jgi:multidrug resistance efflux pump
MIGDLDVSGIFLPTLLVLMGITYCAVFAGARRAHAPALLPSGLAPGIVQRGPLRRAAVRRGLTQPIPDDMKKPFLTIGRVVLTLLIVTFAVVLVWRMVMYYMFAPWTRDGHIRADVVQIAPDVSGLIQQVEVKDNQLVKRGQVLFSIDQDRFKLALRQANAAVADREETLAQAQREAKRNRGLGNLVPAEQLEESQSRVARAQSALAEALVTVDSAQLNLDRSVIRSPVDGYVNDRAPRVARVRHCRAARCCPWSTATLSTSTATFEETKLDGIHVGQSPWTSA